ncbi:orotate phosphoribosyltransferase-like protein [Halobacteriales archaeon QH_8_67_36]|nr:MAG: orotate phosphoribosyltransferase-like protein [Halobacteriales archaeon QH_8_67_36]
MKNIDDLVDSAADLAERGLSKGEIADELNVSRETASCAMADLLSKQGEDVDLTIGIEKAGAPLATTVARELDTDLGTYAPSKHQWDDDESEAADGSFSRNFAQIRDRDCYVVDDTITSGNTMTETVEAIQQQGGNPIACVVLADKRGIEEIHGVPVYSLLQVIRVGSDQSSA